MPDWCEMYFLGRALKTALKITKKDDEGKASFTSIYAKFVFIFSKITAIEYKRKILVGSASFELATPAV